MDDWVAAENQLNETPGGCGTAACFAGFVVFVNKYKRMSSLYHCYIDQEATSALKLPEAPEAEWHPHSLADKLYIIQEWPRKFRQKYEKIEAKGRDALDDCYVDSAIGPADLAERCLSTILSDKINQRFSRQLADVALRRFRHFLREGQ